MRLIIALSDEFRYGLKYEKRIGLLWFFCSGFIGDAA